MKLRRIGFCFVFSIPTLLSSVICLLFSDFSAFAAETVQVEARAWPTKVKVGDEIKLFIKADKPKNYTIIYPTHETKIAPFEIKAIGNLPEKGANRIQEGRVLTLTVFELGDLKIPPIPVSYKNPSGRTGQVLTEAIPIKVLSVGKRATDKDDIRPIKNPIILDQRIIYASILGALTLALFVILIAKIVIRRKKVKEIDLESLKPPHERAGLELERLLKKNFIADGKIKEFYSEIADILRRYFERAFQIEMLELTTFEILAVLKQKEFDVRLSERIKAVLENADLVKFAKFTPPKSLHENIVTEVKNIIEMTKPKQPDLVPQTKKGTR